MRDESQAVIERYKRRTRVYEPLCPAVNRTRQEFERALVRCLSREKLGHIRELKVMEIGCGSGGNLLQLLRLGFQSDKLVGNELQERLVEAARKCLPTSIRIFSGDALDLDLPPESFDIVLQSLVFSSLLDNDFQQALAEKMWSLVKPGGGVLWYDMAYDNPSNPDVRGCNRRRIKHLFPEAEMVAWRITLAPPLSRLVTKVHPGLYAWFNCFFSQPAHPVRSEKRQAIKPSIKPRVNLCH